MLDGELRPNCTTCGLPLSGNTCTACGGSGAPLALADGMASSASAYAPDPMRPELDLAYGAWSKGDVGRMISHCLTAGGAGDVTLDSSVPATPSFRALVKELAVFVRLQTDAGLVVIETPIAKLPLTQYVPSLRLALELSDRDTPPVRLSVRNDIVMMRFVAKSVALTPSTFCDAIDSVAAAALEASRVFVGTLQARSFSSDEHHHMLTDGIPRGVTLADELPTSLPQSPLKAARPSDKGAAAKAFERTGTPREIAQRTSPPPGRSLNSQAGRPTPVAEIPAVLMPPGGLTLASQRATPARLDRKTPLEARIPPGIPGISAPAATQGAPAQRLKPPTAPAAPNISLQPRPAPQAMTSTAVSPAPPTAMVPPTAPAVAPGPARPAPTQANQSIARMPTIPRAQTQQNAANNPAAFGRTMVSGDEPGTPTAPSPAPTQASRVAVNTHADPLADTFIGDAQQAVGGNGPGDPLCALLHRAQTLGAVLSFADQPATMCLLIRATVYRAIYEHEQAAPRAVALLFNATVPMTREIFITAPGVRRGSMAIPSASPAFEVMARIVAQRGDAEPGEPLAIQPITTAQEAKQHLARYVSEIDQAPTDLELRHFLALGALSELLTRTKLPAATLDRLRGIITHAQKEGAKQQIVDLMMTALTRMIA
ncbi:MAG: hypothetical protein U0271_35185 [Polyangiaceae bacterium]